MTIFGGIIGVEKNLLWVVIFAISAVGFCSTKTKKDIKTSMREKDNKFHGNSQISNIVNASTLSSPCCVKLYI